MNIGKFVLNVVVAFIAFGALYQGGNMIFADRFASMNARLNPEDKILVAMLGYHFVQTVVFVWLYSKAVGSGDMKSGAMFGVMVGLYLLATDSNWFVMLKDFPGEGRMPLGILHIVNGALVGALLAFMQGKGWGLSQASSTED